MIENVDYELVPVGDDHWNIRLLAGDFTETVISFGTVRIEEEAVRFDFDVIYSPIDAEPQDEGLQEVAGMVLYSIIEAKIKNDSSEHKR
jgi:hypothetical protein